MNDTWKTILDNLPALITAGLAVVTYINSHRQAKLIKTIENHVDVATSPLKKKIQQLEKQLQGIEDTTGAIRKELEENNLETARVDLMQAIEYAPKEHKAILDLADYYFGTLKGDTWMSGIFMEWSIKEKVDVSRIIEKAKHLERYIK